MTALLAVEDLRVEYALAPPGPFRRAPRLRAVDAVSFSVTAGETLGVVGESGCGKSSLARAVLGLTPSEGRIDWQGRSVRDMTARERQALRRDLQIVFQDPLASLDPRMTAGRIIAEPLATHELGLSHAETAARVATALAEVGLDPLHANRYPHEFSGGQCQRIAIARATILGPKLLLCDEPVSALDVSVQAQIVNLLIERQARLGLAMIFVSHNLAVVRHVSHRIAVLYLGRLVEIGPAADVFARPRHPYTRALVAAVPVADPARERARVRVALPGDPPSPLAPPAGCAFHGRCAHAVARCATARPALEPEGDRAVACHRWRELTPADSGGDR